MAARWLEWGQALQAIAQNGIAYSHNPFDIERYREIQRIAAEMISANGDIEPERLLHLFEIEEGYATPKIDVRGAAFRDGKILLVRELLDEGRWTLPGGWADAGDTPSGAVEREMREESGYAARATKLAMVYERHRHGHPQMYFAVFKLFFLCEITGGAAADSLETGGAAFFDVNDLPELSLGRVTPEEIHTLFMHHRDPSLPTEFD